MQADGRRAWRRPRARTVAMRCPPVAQNARPACRRAANARVSTRQRPCALGSVGGTPKPELARARPRLFNTEKTRARIIIQEAAKAAEALTALAATPPPCADRRRRSARRSAGCRCTAPPARVGRRHAAAAQDAGLRQSQAEIARAKRELARDQRSRARFGRGRGCGDSHACISAREFRSG
eukprot:6177984-Pleurochrysis_carterae.AAC.1